MSDSNRGEKVYETVADLPEGWINAQPVTLDDLLPVVERIAAALEAQVRPRVCGEMHSAAGKPCVLDNHHVGHHATADGRLHWLDDE